MLARSAVGNVLTTPPPSQGGGGVPLFMQGIADYGVRNLTGSYAPTGAATMFDTVPTEWHNYEGPYGVKGIFTAWSGGYGDAAGKRLFVHGGGDGDAANNGLFVFGLGGDANPAGWTLAANSLSTIASVPTGNYTYLYNDNKPSAVHTYGGLNYNSALDRFYTIGGSKFNNGVASGAATGRGVYYDLANSRWSSDSANGGTGSPWVTLANDDLGSVLLASPDNSQLLYLSATTTSYFINASTGATTASNSTGQIPWGSADILPCAAYDSANGRYVLFGMGGATALVVTVNWAAHTISTSSVSLTGANASELGESGPSVEYDAARAQFIVFGMRNSLATTLSSIYLVDANTFAVTKVSLTGDSITWIGGSQGSYNRHVWFPAWRIIGTVHGHDVPVSLIKV